MRQREGIKGKDPEEAKTGVNQISDRAREANNEYGIGFTELVDLLNAEKDNVIGNITKHEIPAYQNIFSTFSR